VVYDRRISSLQQANRIMHRPTAAMRLVSVYHCRSRDSTLVYITQHAFDVAFGGIACDRLRL
jgi:hypothetical protein